jgi:hypothetical protein
MNTGFRQRFVFSFVGLLFVLAYFNHEKLLIADLPERRCCHGRLESNGIPPFSEHSVRIYIGVVSFLIHV